MIWDLIMLLGCMNGWAMWTRKRAGVIRFLLRFSVSFHFQRKPPAIRTSRAPLLVRTSLCPRSLSPFLLILKEACSKFSWMRMSHTYVATYFMYKCPHQWSPQNSSFASYSLASGWIIVMIIVLFSWKLLYLNCCSLMWRGVITNYLCTYVAA